MRHWKPILRATTTNTRYSVAVDGKGGKIGIEQKKERRERRARLRQIKSGMTKITVKVKANKMMQRELSRIASRMKCQTASQ